MNTSVPDEKLSISIGITRVVIQRNQPQEIGRSASTQGGRFTSTHAVVAMLLGKP